MSEDNDSPTFSKIADVRDIRGPRVGMAELAGHSSFSFDLAFEPSQTVLSLIVPKLESKKEVKLVGPDGRTIMEGYVEETVNRVDIDGTVALTVVPTDIYPEDYHEESD